MGDGEKGTKAREADESAAPSPTPPEDVIRGPFEATIQAMMDERDTTVADLRTELDRMKAERDEALRALAAAQTAIRELPVITDEMEAELEQVKAERDAALALLRQWVALLGFDDAVTADTWAFLQALTPQEDKG